MKCNSFSLNHPSTIVSKFADLIVPESTIEAQLQDFINTDFHKADELYNVKDATRGEEDPIQWETEKGAAAGEEREKGHNIG